MEDDDGDMPVTIEGAKEGDKHLEKPQHSSINSEDIIESEKNDSICSLKEKNGDVAAADHDSIKPKIKNTLGVPEDIESETNNSESHSDSEVPLNPKKVNGEVELPKYNEKDENADNSMDAVSLTKSDVPENEDDTSQHEKRTSRKRKHSISSNELPESDHSDAGDNKGVKKPALADALITTINNGSQDNISGEVDPSVKCTSESLKTAAIEFPVIITPPTLQDGVESSAQLTEYAQYLGLQPTVKFKCYKCGETGFPSMPVLQEHQNVCFKTLNKSQPLVKPTQTATVEPTPSTNFRITRKVYLCSVCGTYYENWNLFLHIREVHKRHICLFCLGMFAHSDNLVSHLSVRHGVIEESFSSADDFLNEYKGSCFLMCCTCEKLFTERENFFDHNCVEGLSVSVDKACSLCGLKGAHFPTCRQAFTDSDASPPQSTSSVSTALKEDPVQNPPLILKEQPGKKQATTANKIAEKIENHKEGLDLENVSENHEKLRDLSDLDDEYDISNAASFCHVNIDETPERNKANVEKDNSLKDMVSSCKNKTASETPPIKQALVENDEDTCLEESNVKDNLETTAIEPENDKSKICEAEQPEQGAADQKNNTGETPLTSDVTEPVEEQKELSKDSVEKIPVDLELEKSPTKHDFHCENANLDDTSDKNVHIEETKVQEQEEPDASLLKSDSCPRSPPKSEALSASKTPSATEAESESETSDSAEETDESSSSSESSDESTHNDDINKEKVDVADSDIDNGDSDKMSLIVDETKSEDEKEMQEEVNMLDEMHTDGVQQTENVEDDMREELNELEINKETDHGSENENQEAAEEMSEKKEVENKPDDFVENIQLAGDDVPLLELTLEENLDTLTIQTLLKESVKISCLNCVYCNHAKKIAVNGKQLALHLLAEHRFAPVVCSDSGELTEVDGFVDKLKTSLLDLQQMYFNTDSYDNMDPNSVFQYDRTYECFHCHFVTTLHKELYVHNRKMHQKTILLCIMCKSNFYSYSELLCHLCPGIYVPESNITFRCCLCTVDGLPSAFRLMVHLRKRHHACDVCLETTGDQQKLSNHVWKHKLHHLCYRCGIAYRNKPDITKHLFWKHGTESVLCKKCLQKKWPHVYHFCIPPNAFVCEECNSTFSRAVALKVHKRIHSGDLPYACDECEERYISRKLVMKHQLKHRDPPVEENVEDKMEENGPSTEAESQKDLTVDATDVTMCDTDELKQKVADDSAEQLKLGTADADSDSIMKSEVLAPDMQDETPTKENAEESAKVDEKETERKSRVVDVYDLPPLNLSSESDDSDEEEKSIPKEEKSTVLEMPTQPAAAEKKLEEMDKTNEMFPTEEQPAPIVDGIWDNFKNYKANLERRESQQAEFTESSAALYQNTAFRERESAEVIEIINMDHDYCGPAAGTSQSKDIIDDKENVPIMSETSPQENLMLLDEQKETDEDKKPVDADHNYCYNNPNSPSSNIEKEKESLPAPSSDITPSKKKQKSPKKKPKRSGSSSSSESSSNSDSSSCSCGTNCSCSSSSSSSSGSSSSSSDSDSSTSEGRRRQAARRERRRERAKKRKSEEISDTAPVQLEVTDTANTGPALQSEALAAPIGPELEETELPIRESDLDTDETETDEDFYDKYPQKLANKLLAEKRNQLLLLAAVAPVNNGTMTQTGQSPLTSSVEDQTGKRKVKTKKRKRSHLPHTNTMDHVEQNMKMNIPSDYYTTQNPTFSKSSLTSTAMSPLHASSQSHPAVSHPDPSSLSTTYHSTGSGSETESKRASKRKRVPKRFYGDSSDEETEQQPAVKWRKVVSTTSGSPLQTNMPASAFAYKTTPLMTPEPRVPPAPAMEDKSEEEAGEDSDSDVRKSSSDSSNSESEAEKEDDASDGDSDADSLSVFQTNTSTSVKEGETVQQKNENLYCYCQCPYDEVSEMIACDGKDCTIEWFHFECVGIMVPPKGKWFCPDCRKRATSRSDYVPNV